MRTVGGAHRVNLPELTEVDAWLIDLDAPADTAPASARDLLAPLERERASSYLRAQDGARFAASRGWLRVILGRYLEVEPAGLPFAAGPGGRPVLAGEYEELLHFSLSRSAGRALIAVSGTPVGADIELVDDRAGLSDLVASGFGDAETACIRSGCGGSRLRGFYRHWTAKEAYLKATSRGLAGLDRTELACGTHPAIRADGRIVAEWAVSLLEPAASYVAAVVGASAVGGCRAGR
jgi:4'-phosphopantetheinyl transferase